MRIVSVIATLCFAAMAFGQTPKSCSTDSTSIISIQNLASGGTTLSPGALARVLWCDLEFPAPTTPITSVVVDGQPVQAIFFNLQQTTGISSVAYRGYPGFTLREVDIYLNSSLKLPHNPVVHLLRNGADLAAAEIEVEDFSPGLFTMDQKPAGPVMARNSMDYIGGNNLVYAGDIITIYATGLGPTRLGPQTIVAPNETLVMPEVYVGKQPAIVIASNQTTGSFFTFPPLAGIYEVTFVVPPIDPSTDTQPIYIQIGRFKSNVATLAVRP